MLNKIILIFIISITFLNANQLNNKKTDLDITLTEKEQEWINKKKPIKYVFDPDWAPFEWTNDLGKHTGIIYDILSLVTKKSGIEFEQVSVEKWSDAVKLAESQKVDMYSGVAQTENKKLYMNFTKNSIYKTPYVFIVHKDDPHDHFETFKTLEKGERIAVVDGYAIHNILKEKHPDIELITVPSVSDGLKKLQNNKIEIFILNAATAKYYINKKDFNELRISTKTEYSLDLKIAIQQNLQPEIISILDKAIELISEKELSDVYAKWTEVTVEKTIDWNLLLEIAGIGLLIIAFILYNNRKLTSMVNEKTIELKSIVDSFDRNVIFSRTDLKGNITHASEAFCELSGYKVNELIGKPHNIIRHPDMPAELFKGLWEALKNETCIILEIKNIKKNGESYWVESKMEPDYDIDGNHIGYSAIRVDITSKKEVEKLSENLEKKVYERTKELDEERKFIGSIVSSSQDALIVIDMHSNVTVWNESATNIFGYTKNEILGESIEVIIPQKFRELHHAGVKRVSSNGEKKLIGQGVIEIEAVHKDGKIIPIDLALNTFMINDAMFFSANIRDISERVELTKKQQELNKEINAQKQFVTTLLDSQEQIIITTDGEELISANKTFLEFFNLDNMEEFTKDYNCICDKFDTNAPKDYLQKQMNDNQTWINYIINRPNQTHKTMITIEDKSFIFSVTATNLPNEYKLKSAVFTDITEMENAKKEIELILSNILLPVLITSKRDRKILYANKYAQNQYEVPLDKIIGSDIDNVYTIEGQQEHIIDTINKYGFIENSEEQFRTSTNKIFTALLSVTPIKYKNEDCYIGMITDITKQKEMENEVREIHKNTRDSIEYASLIQSALIPDYNLFGNYFKDYFTIWHPKDVVGGDIYLFEELRNDDECLLMVIDCTGHGVPGAFVTMLVKAIERQVVAKIENDKDIDVSPAWILSYFNKTMKKLLRQEDESSISNAGFDGGIIYYNKKDNIIKFSGAETPLFYIDDGQFKTIKGNRHSIGYKKSDANYKFKEHVIDLKEGMQFYLTTDGYLDQNGGEKGFPFGKTKFKNIITENYNQSFADQEEILLYALQEYQGKEDRNDDVTIVSFKI